VTRTRKIRWFFYGISNISWSVVGLRVLKAGPFAQLSRTSVTVLIILAFAASTLNLIGGLQENKAPSAANGGIQPEEAN
jgi:hypothetical protein